MRSCWGFLILVLAAIPAAAQEPRPAPPAAALTAALAGDMPSATGLMLSEDGPAGPCPGSDRPFGSFIGFMSDPLQNIDPRAVNEFYPIFASAWTSEAGPAPSSDFQLYGAGLTIAPRTASPSA